MNSNTYSIIGVFLKIGVMAFFASLLAPQSLTANELNPLNLRIVWEQKEGRTDSAALTNKNANKLWASVCGNLSNGLLIGKGPWGMGVFASVACYIGEKRISGVDAPDAWALRYREDDSLTTLKLYAGLKKDSPELSSAGYAGGPESMQFFLDQGFADLISLKILNQLPMMGWIAKESLVESDEYKTRSVFVPSAGIRLYKSVAPPLALNVFKGDTTGQMVMPEIVGKATRAAFNDPVDGTKPKSGSRKNPKTKSIANENFNVIWKFDESSVSASEDSGLWIHDTKGARKLSKELNLAINESAEVLGDAIRGGIFSSFLKGIKATTTAGYVGVRYGSQIFKGNPLLRKTAFLGLLAEVRGGPLNGLRYYWDNVPETKATINGLSTKIEWSRHIIGKSFGLNLKTFIDRIDLTPKLGLWNFDAALVDSLNSDGSAATVGKFKIDRSFSVSIEVGAEWLSSWYTIRSWYSYDYAKALSSVTKKYVTSNRIGLDTYWTPGKRFRILRTSLRPTLLGFFIYETITLSSNSQISGMDDGEREIVAVTFSSGYAGAGIAVTW